MSTLQEMSEGKEFQLSHSLAPVFNSVKGLVELRQQCDSPVYQRPIAELFEEKENHLDEILFDEHAVETSVGQYSVTSTDLEGDDVMGGNFGIGKQRYNKKITINFMTEPFGVYDDIEIDRIEEGPLMGLNTEQIHRGNKEYLKFKKAERQLRALLSHSDRVESTTDKLNDPVKDPLAILQNYNDKLSMAATLIVMSKNTLDRIKRNPVATQQRKYKSLGVKEWLEEELGAEIYVATSPDDKTLLGDKVIFLHKNAKIGKPTSAAVFKKNILFKNMDPSWGQKAGDFIIRNIPMPEYGSNGAVRMKASWEYDAKVVDPSLYFVVTDAIDPSIKYTGPVSGGSGGTTDPALVAAVAQMAASSQEMVTATEQIVAAVQDLKTEATPAGKNSKTPPASNG